MLSSIQPLGERSRGNRFATTATAFFIGAVAGGISMGLVLHGVGMVVGFAVSLAVGGWPWVGLGAVVPTSYAILMLGVVGLVALVADMSGHPLPSLPRQVNERWITTYRGWVYGVGFGYQLGLGVVTYITAPATWVWLAALFLSPSWLAAAAVGAAFGLGRGVSVVTTRAISTPAALTRYHQRLNRGFGRFNIVSRLAVAGLSGGAVLSALGLAGGGVL